MKVSIHEALLLVIAIIALFLYWNKPQNVVRTEEKIVEVHTCSKLSNEVDIHLCVATESCKQAGRTLKWFEMKYNKDNSRTDPIVECENIRTEEKK